MPISIAQINKIYKLYTLISYIITVIHALICRNKSSLLGKCHVLDTLKNIENLSMYM